ncbi:hypothetical protein HPP92_001155 [Vanilla planifolia]|uniref:Pentatricopeptide repeat-containing protein n=1 Tax=Vanilla planifolia TaxID=51239 RepID=A0A835VDA7_VANPL|nr:hypothetical protein HPP92_001155 [Vanilla planifolia]
MPTVRPTDSLNGPQPGQASRTTALLGTRCLVFSGKTRQFETMVSLLQEMGKDGYLSMESFKISIKAFAAAREMKKCMGIFKLMKLYDFQAGLETFNCLIDALAKAKLGKEAQELFDRMKGQFHPDLRTYTVLLYGFCKIKNLAEAGRVWNDMLDSGFIPDVVAHNAMLEGLIRGHQGLKESSCLSL